MAESQDFAPGLATNILASDEPMAKGIRCQPAKKKMPKFFFMNKVTNIVVEQAVNGISRIKLNDPKSYNALSSKTLKLLIDIFKKLNNDRKTKVIILEGLGKGFSAGHDLKEVRSLKGKTKYQKLLDQLKKNGKKII